MRKEKLTFLETPIHLRCRTHVHTGQGRFCLVEAVSAPVIDGAEARCPTRDGLEFLLHVTMFRAKYGKNGELVVTPCRPGCSYLLPSYAAGVEVSSSSF